MAFKQLMKNTPLQEKIISASWKANFIFSCLLTTKIVNPLLVEASASHTLNEGSSSNRKKQFSH